MRLTNNHNLPQHLVDKIAAQNSGDPYSGEMDGKEYFRVTELIKPPLIRSLKQSHTGQKGDKIVLDASDFLNVTLGTAVHAALEGEDSEDVLFETGVAMEFNVDGKKIWVVGTVDEYWPQLNEMCDNKTGMEFLHKKPIDPTYEAQTNIYAYLLKMHDQPNPPRIQIRYWYKDWTRSGLKRKRDYPLCPIQHRSVLVWTKEQAEAYILDRLRDHLNNPFRPCTMQERAFGGTWSVVSINDPDGQSKRNLDTREEAEAWLMTKPYEKRKELTVAFRGKDQLCKHYCFVRTVCKYAQEKGYV